MFAALCCGNALAQSPGAVANDSSSSTGTQQASHDATSPPPPADTWPKLAKNSVKLFDMRRSDFDVGLVLGPIWYRPTNEGAFTRGVGELRIGSGVHTRTPLLSAGGLTDVCLRSFSGSEYSLSYVHQAASRLKLGPLEPEALFGFAIVTVDNLQHDLSFGLFSPRVGFGVGLRLGGLRIGVQANSEYQWRWLARDVFLYGLMVDVRLQSAQPTVQEQRSELPRGFGPGSFGSP